MPITPGEEDLGGRVDLRANKKWLAEVRRVADLFGLDVSAYIRQAVSRQLLEDKKRIAEAEPSGEPSRKRGT